MLDQNPSLSLYRYAEKKPTLAMTLSFLVGFHVSLVGRDDFLGRQGFAPSYSAMSCRRVGAVRGTGGHGHRSGSCFSQPTTTRVGLEMLFALTHELLDGTTAIGDEYRQRKLEVSADGRNAASLKSKRLSHELGQPEKLWTPNQAGLWFNATDGNRVNNQTSFRNRTLVAWVEEESRVLHRKSIETVRIPRSLRDACRPFDVSSKRCCDGGREGVHLVRLSFGVEISRRLEVE